MSKYTTELRFICETAAGLTESAGYANVNEIIEKAIPKIFNFDFPIFDDDYKNVLCTKILKHFYTREISEETVGLWRLRLETKMNEIMPYYNNLYKAWSVDFNPLNDTDLTRKHTLERVGNTEGKQNSETESNGTNRDIYSDTPQGSLQNVENETYLTNARKITDNETVTGNNTYTQDITSTDDYLENIAGKSSGASYSRLLDEYREVLINIDMMIIDELEPLFFQLW